jgi:thiopeptide-type bacteriocin biosynthesis protein
MGNILCRPVLRAYEIPYLGRSGAPEEAQIPVSDLRISIAGQRIVLRSARLGREVIPRMTTAHNTGIAALGVYRFLAALHAQDMSSIGWSWGPFDGAAFTPRVTHGRLVLAPARWTVLASELKGATSLEPAQRYRRVQAMRAAHRLPRWVALADGDNVLPLDLDNALHVDTLATFAKNRPALTLVEVAPGEEDLVASGPEGRFVHEIVVPFVSVREPAAPRLPRVPQALQVALATRKLPPATDWLYAKLYTGTAAADAVLVNVVAPLLSEMRDAGACDRWFFIRYGDPDWHLRVRLHGEPARLLREALPRLLELARPWLDDGRIWKIQLDTYEREIERYGGHAGMDLAEDVFSADSEAALGIVERLEPGEGNDARWRLALRGIHLLLLDLGLDLPLRATIMRTMREAYAREHNADAALDAALGARFRAERPALEALLATKVGAEHPLDPGFVVLEARSAKLAELAQSFVHMHVNRVLRSEQRTQELALCDFLARLYESEVARSRPKSKKE